MDSSHTKRTASEGLGVSYQNGGSRIGHFCFESGERLPQTHHSTSLVGALDKGRTGAQNKAHSPNPEPDGKEAVQIQIRERISQDLAVLAAESPPNVTIPQELSHPLALKTEKLLVSGKENDAMLLVPKAGKAAHLLVSREQLSRALRIANALFLALEEQGYDVTWPKKKTRG